MKVSGILANNGIKLLSGLANNEDSLAAMVVKDWIGDGATVYTYKKNGGKDDAREKAIEEFGTGAIWLFAIPAIKKLLEWTVYPIFNLNPNFDPRLLDNKEELEVAKNCAKSTDEKILFNSLEAPNEVIKSLSNKQMYKGFAVGKFLIATSLAAVALTKIIKFKQKTTSDRIQKDKKQNLEQTNNTLLAKNISQNKTFNSFTNKNNQISFTGNLAEFMYNPIKNTMILDGVIAATRLIEARKEERLEVGFKELCQVVFIYGLAKPIQNKFEDLGKFLKCPIKLDPKNLFAKDLSKKIADSAQDIANLKDSKNFIEDLTNIDINKPIIELLANEGVITLTKDKSAISMLKPISKDAVINALDNLEDINKPEHIKNLSKIKGFKAFAVVANVLIAAGIMGVIQPKITIWLRKKLFGTNENPAIAQQEKEAKLNA